ncbi:MAG: NfeD family protein [Parvibaculum sp.]|uniref:NfeD family protein n=1 Tax=Parvibaculum sp. TaxID=2024848 RepID=UPI003C793E94
MPDIALEEIGMWTWWVLAAVFGILELLVPGVFFIWLAAAAAVVGALLLVVDFPVTVQVALFAMLSVAAVWASRRYFSRHAIETDRPLLNQRAQSYVGRTFTLEQPIHNGRGKIRIGDTFWLVQGPDLPAGANVHVTGTESGILIVEAVR